MCFLNLGVKGRNLARIVTTEPPAIRCNTKHVNKNSLLAAEPIQDVDKNRMPKQTKKTTKKKNKRIPRLPKFMFRFQRRSKQAWVKQREFQRHLASLRLLSLGLTEIANGNTLTACDCVGFETVVCSRIGFSSCTRRSYWTFPARVCWVTLSWSSPEQIFTLNNSTDSPSSQTKSVSSAKQY